MQRGCQRWNTEDARRKRIKHFRQHAANMNYFFYQIMSVKCGFPYMFSEAD